MKTINVSGLTIENYITDLSKVLGGTQTSDFTASFLKFDSHLGTGYAKGYQLENGVGYMELDIHCKEELLLVQDSKENSSYNFVYLSSGNSTHSFHATGENSVLNKLQAIIIKNTGTQNQFLLKGNKHYVISMLFVGATTANTNSLLYTGLREALHQLQLNDNEVYIGSHNLKILAKIQELQEIQHQGIVKALYVGSILTAMMGMYIEQYGEDIEGSENQTGSLTKKEMETIQEISTFIKNYPDIQYTLKYLYTKTGISPCKLQEGFKLLHNRTVTDYIRNIRVEAAEHLIKTTEMNISEIVYSIGLTSRSYFSKIFKEKYNCSPKYYQEHQNALAVTA